MGFWARLFGLEAAPVTGGADGTLAPTGTLAARKIERREVKPPEERRTLAEQLDGLCADLRCSYRIRPRDGRVHITLTWPDDHDQRAGESVSGAGEDAAEALRALRARLGGDL